MMDCRANLLTIWWIFVLGVVAGGIVIATLIYYSADININEMHANVLASRISECLLNGEEISVDLENFDLFDECKIDKKVFQEGDFFVNIMISGNNVLFDETYGNNELEKDCDIVKSIETKSQLKCVKQKRVVSYLEKDVILEIVAGSRQEGVKN